jgi:KDO2-lipid IV(A) lauroyltransferase
MGGLTVIVGEIHNEPVDRLVNNRRRKAGMTPVPREGDLRPLLRTLRRGDTAAVLMDQATRVPSRPVPFFGTRAPTATGFASLAIRTGAPVLPVAIQRDGSGHQIVIGDVIDPALFSGADPELDFLQACNDALENFVRRNPAEWVWFHKRWPDNTMNTDDSS